MSILGCGYFARNWGECERECCRTITHWYTDFRSYLGFHEMRDVPDFAQRVTYVIIYYTPRCNLKDLRNINK